ncbi:MAG: DUF58 domain-containing protein [Planctomycetes bacterium]|nr:DUF58 domain-containing protein [Planctomycetota bacterium]
MSEKLLDEDFMRRIESLSLVSRKIFRGKVKGERRSKKRGYSSEFADYRNYVEGDDLRFIDWNIYGRLDRLFLKLFLEEEDLHVHLVVDTSASMSFGTPSKLGYAKKVAAAVAYVGLSNNDRVQVHAFNSKLGLSSGAWRGKKFSWQLFDFVESLAPSGETNLEKSCSAFAQKTNSGNGVVIFISDFLDPEGYEEGIKKITGAGADTYVIHVLSPEEINPELQGDLRLVDAEDGSFQEITVSKPLLSQYQETLKNFCGGIKDSCVRRGANYIFSSTEVPFDQLVLNYLRKGGLFS